MGLRYGGKMVNDYSAMRGPCPEGYHVPYNTERTSVIELGVSLGAWTASTGSSMFSYLKIPSCGYLRASNGTKASNSYGYCSSSMGYGTTTYPLYCYNGGNVKATSTSSKSDGCPIRPFRDLPIVPDNTRTELFKMSGSPQGAYVGIYHNSSLGMISISDTTGENWTTIADKNLGATTVYNSGDTLSETNCGKFYQRGNNYGFPYTGATTTSSTKVDTTDYGPGNYYSSSTFITVSSGNWSSVNNNNLRGGETGVQQRPAPIVRRYYGGKMKTSYSAMRGPCPVGFHVPLTSESTTLVTALSDLGMDTSNGADISQYLKIPYAGYRYYTTGNISQQGVAGGYWASDGYSDSTYSLGNCVIFTSTVLNANNNQYRTLGLPVRPFKDTPVIPDSGWTQLYAGTGNSGIFHNSTLGLISISSDGTNWITIADKNLGATTVYNNGDTLSESNCGGYFQRGNNYMFPFTGNITTTYGYVDATNYGPGNYYSDSTFIKSTLSTRDWCYPANNDLRGRTTGPQQTPVEILKTYYGNTLIWEKP